MWVERVRDLGAELLQFAGMLIGFAVVVLMWLRIIYLPARTVEKWEARPRKSRRDRRND